MLRRGQVEAVAALAMAVLISIAIAVFIRFSLFQRQAVAEQQRLSSREVERLSEFVAFRLEGGAIYATPTLSNTVFIYRAIINSTHVLWSNITDLALEQDTIVFRNTWVGQDLLTRVRDCRARFIAVSARGRLFAWCPQVYFSIVNNTVAVRALAIFIRGGYYYAIPRLNSSNYSIAYVYRGGQWVKEPLQVYLWDANATYNIFYAPYDGYVVIEPRAIALGVLGTAAWFSTPSPSPQPYATTQCRADRLNLVRVVELNRTAVFNGSALAAISTWSLTPIPTVYGCRYGVSSVYRGYTYSIPTTVYDIPWEWSIDNVKVYTSAFRVCLVGIYSMCFDSSGAAYSWICLDTYCTRVRVDMYPASGIQCGGASTPCRIGSNIYAYWQTGTTTITNTYNLYSYSATDIYTVVEVTVDPTNNPSYYRTTTQRYTANQVDIGIGAPVKLITASNGNKIAVADFIAQLLS